MSLRQLVDGDCGGVNPLMQLGGQFTRDTARKDEGFSNTQFERSMRPDEQMVNEFLGQVAAPPQSFQMNALLQEMREIEQANTYVGQSAPSTIHELASQEWSKEFGMERQQTPQMVHMQPQQQQLVHVREFFDEEGPSTSASLLGQMTVAPYMPMQTMSTPYLAICPPNMASTSKFFEENTTLAKTETDKLMPQATTNEYVEDWIEDYQNHAKESEQEHSNYSEKFWQRLQAEWQKLSTDADHPWLSEYGENYDPYKEYDFVEDNPMTELENALEKGKEYLQKSDIPSAVLCFEAAVKKEPENAEAWELLGIAQAENEMDPQSIAALKRSLALRPDNTRVLMALAVCYTNESLQSQALRMLINWMQVNPKYNHLLEQHPELQTEGNNATASSLVMGSKLEAVQNLFLDAVRQNPQEVDADVQEALGVLYNLSSEYDKAVDCFRAALTINPQSGKIWNRLGASLANGSRSVEAVEAYQRALQLEPGFIRVRYNVGVCCMNLKAYKQAVEHLLTALNMQANASAARELPAGAAAIEGSQTQMSESIWSTLNMVLSLMGRSDLREAVNEHNLNVLNEAFMDAA